MNPVLCNYEVQFYLIHRLTCYDEILTITECHIIDCVSYLMGREHENYRKEVGI